MLEGQGNIWFSLFRFVETMTLKCAVELCIPDIIHSHGCPITLFQIASDIGSPSLELNSLARIMNVLTQMKLFDANSQSAGCDEDTLYSLTPSSKWLLHDANPILGPFVLMFDLSLTFSALNHLSQSVREGGSAFNKAHGSEIWDVASQDSKFAKRLIDFMDYTARIANTAMLTDYKDGFNVGLFRIDYGKGWWFRL